ncbi:MAG: hypothetical protein HZB26_17905 [Candidatus Hydrogenedentes bacterium]|nr:hypothetical protein [Candidatus Hydrogenedentota bacterium]
MSFDLGVWYPHKRLSDDEAAELYVHLSAGDTTGVMPHLAIGSFYADLIAKLPEIDSVPGERIDDQYFCPWSPSLERSPAHIIVFCVWSKAEYVHQFVHRQTHKPEWTYEPDPRERAETIVAWDGSTEIYHPVRFHAGGACEETERRKTT